MQEANLPSVSCHITIGFSTQKLTHKTSCEKSIEPAHTSLYDPRMSRISVYLTRGLDLTEEVIHIYIIVHEEMEGYTKTSPM